MLAKLIVWAATRIEAVDRMRRALSELTIVGIESSREFHLRVMDDEEFRRGEIEIQWLERRLPSLLGVAPPPAEVRVAAIAAALLADRDRTQRGRTGALASSITAGTSGVDGWTAQARREGLRG
jgi:acetyl-CoA carboxylase biotin carboxylase subunit